MEGGEIMEEVGKQAYRAYKKQFGKNADEPCHDEDFRTYKKKEYVRLYNSNSILVVYEIISEGFNCCRLKFVSSDDIPKLWEMDI
jgi:hypothetical protein